MRTFVGRSVVLLAAGFVLAVLPIAAQAQEAKSVALVRELTQLLDQGKLGAIAAKDASAPDLFVAALYYPGSQLMVVSARYAVPSILAERLAKQDFTEVYTDLNSAAVPGSKILVMDIGADGLKLKKENNRFDTCDIGDKSYVFDGEWKKQKFVTEDDYAKKFGEADAAYSKALAALIAQLKKG
jgi:hypothetical protein